jgi:hypothetical protein
MYRILSVLLLIQSMAFSNTCQDMFEFYGHVSKSGFWGTNVTGIDSTSVTAYSIDSVSKERTEYAKVETSYFNGTIIERDSSSKGDETKTKGTFAYDENIATYLLPSEEHNGSDTLWHYSTNGLMDSIVRKGWSGYSLASQSIEQAYRTEDSLLVTSVSLTSDSYIDTLAMFQFGQDTTSEYNWDFDNYYLNGDSTCLRLESAIANLFIEGTKHSWGWHILRKNGENYWEWQYMSKQKFLSPIKNVNLVKKGNKFIFPNGVVEDCGSEEKCLKLKKNHLGLVW